MKRSHVLLSVSLAFLPALSLEAQNLTWFGSAACFATPSPSSGVAVITPTSCSLSSTTTTSVSWDAADNARDRSTMTLDIGEYASSDWPGGPASNSASNRTLSFAGIGAISNVYLGYFEFDQASDQRALVGEDLSSVYLNMKLFFASAANNALTGNVDYSNMLQITSVERSTGSGQNFNDLPDGIQFNPANWMDFTIGSNSYSFRINALDNYCNNQQGCDNLNTDRYCGAQYVDENFSTSAVQFTGDTQRKLCGQVRYNGSVVPEPSTYLLVAAGLTGLFGVARRRRTNTVVAATNHL